MKKIILFFICGLMVTTSAFAQTSVTTNAPHMGRLAGKTIIKECRLDYPSTITCSNSEESTTFIYASDTMQNVERTFDGYFVNDMIVTKDSVFFCGKEYGTDRGVIGCFKIDDFFWGSGAVNLERNLSTEDGYNVYELTRMVRYTDINNLIHIACIGTCVEYDKIYPCIVDMNPGINPYYRVGYIKDDYETFTDIKLVTNRYSEYYIVTAGYDFVFGRYINLRIYDINNLFSFSGPQNMCHVFSLGPSPIPEWHGSDVLLSDIPGNTFSTVSHRSKNATGYIPYKDSSIIHLAFYDINSLLANSVYSLVANYEVPLGIAPFRKMEQFICSYKTNRIAFLHTYRNTTSSSYLSEYFDINLATLSTAGSFWAYNNPSTQQYGLSLYNSNNCYILSGHDISNPTLLKFQMNTFGYLSGCATKLTYEYEKKENIGSANFKREFVYGNKQSTTLTLNARRIDLPMYIECAQ